MVIKLIRPLSYETFRYYKLDLEGLSYLEVGSTIIEFYRLLDIGSTNNKENDYLTWKLGSTLPSALIDIIDFYRLLGIGSTNNNDIVFLTDVTFPDSTTFMIGSCLKHWRSINPFGIIRVVSICQLIRKKFVLLTILLYIMYDMTELVIF